MDSPRSGSNIKDHDMVATLQNTPQDTGISIYVHWPFCKSKCPYCDFNSHVRASIDMEAWRNAYLRELSSYAELLQGKYIKSIFFGGGTPSLAEPKVFAALLEGIARHALIDNNTEITIEANPTSVEAEKFKAFADIGINRASIGVQSLRPKHLKFLGREHNTDEALKAIDLAARYFHRYSFDLIYTLPEQPLEEWLEDLERATHYAASHLSLYQLTIEKGTQFYKDFRAQLFVMPDDELSANFYTATLNHMRSLGYNRYEISNFASPGNECHHNLTYWRYQDFIGIGPGAHGRYVQNGITYASVKIHAPEQWLQAVNSKGIGLQKLETLSALQVKEEKVLMGMRLESGISRDLISPHADLTHLQNLGLVDYNNERIWATDNGLLLLNSIIPKLL